MSSGSSLSSRSAASSSSRFCGLRPSCPSPWRARSGDPPRRVAAAQPRAPCRLRRQQLHDVVPVDRHAILLPSSRPVGTAAVVAAGDGHGARPGAARARSGSGSSCRRRRTAPAPGRTAGWPSRDPRPLSSSHAGMLRPMRGSVDAPGVADLADQRPGLAPDAQDAPARTVLDAVDGNLVHGQREVGAAPGRHPGAERVAMTSSRTATRAAEPNSRRRLGAGHGRQRRLEDGLDVVRPAVQGAAAVVLAVDQDRVATVRLGDHVGRQPLDVVRAHQPQGV